MKKINHSEGGKNINVINGLAKKKLFKQKN